MYLYILIKIPDNCPNNTQLLFTACLAFLLIFIKKEKLAKVGLKVHFCSFIFLQMKPNILAHKDNSLNDECNFYLLTNFYIMLFSKFGYVCNWTLEWSELFLLVKRLYK